MTPYDDKNVTPGLGTKCSLRSHYRAYHALTGVIVKKDRNYTSLR